MYRLFAAVVTVVLVVAVVLPAAAQTDAAALVGPKIGVGARSSAMGGAFVAVADDVTALYWNPAGLVSVHGLAFRGDLVGRAQNLDAVEDAEDIYDIVDQNYATGLDFNFLRTKVLELDDRPFHAQVTAIGGLAYQGWAVGGYGIGGGIAELDHTAGTGPTFQIEGVDVKEGERVDLSGDGFWQYSQGIATGRRLNDRLAVGVGVRKMEVGFHDKNWSATVQPQGSSPSILVQETGVTDSLTDECTTVDVGLMHILGPQSRAGLVARNITSPDLMLVDMGSQPMSIEVDMVVDAGLAFFSEDGRTMVAADLHNLSNAQNRASTFHLGYEYQAKNWLALRLGSAGNSLTYGLGLDFGFLTIDVAARSGADATDRAGFAFGLEF